MSDAEIIVILIHFHQVVSAVSSITICTISVSIASIFSKKLSYNRFVELEKEVLLQMTAFIKQVLLGECTGISLVDSTPLRVCRNPQFY